MIRGRGLFVLLVGALVVAGCTTTELPEGRDTTTTAASAPAPIGDTPEPSPLEWVACDGLECATLTVPLDYENPAAGELELAVARRTSSGDDPIGTLVVNPGGPGGSGATYLRNGGGGELDDDFDVVSWDPRGVGGSRPLDCARDTSFFALDPQPDDAAERAALERSARTMAAECARADLALLSTLTTETAARDLEQLRKALGDEGLNYLGFSYGSHIGLLYAALFPNRIRAMTLDGVVDPRESLAEFLTGQAVAIEEVLGENLTALREVAARVEVDPLPSRTGTEVGPGTLGVAAFASIYRTTGEQQFTAALDDARDGDGTALARLADTYLSSSSFAAYLGVLCIDGPRPMDVERWWNFIETIEAAAPDLGASVGNELLPCAYWQVAPNDGGSPIDWSPSLPPILLVASTRDAATPLDDAQRVEQDLPNAVLLVRNGPGHTSFGASRCVRDAVSTYLVDLVPPDKGTVCGS